jgi:cytoskeletal protein CcmA (bactofilin family)
MKKRVSLPTDSPDRLNVIVDGSKIIGDIITESNLRIDGEVLGNVSTAAKVVVGSTGFIKGNLTCAEGDIEGKVEGTLKIDGLLTLRSRANIEGEITTSKLQVEEGAQFSGNCRMSNSSMNKTITTTLEQQPKPEEAEENVIY